MGNSLPLVQLSSLDQLRGFVAVGRRMSITLAAQELCLTQSAISRQILALEAQLGVKLLIRGYRSIAFTPAGERLFRSADAVVQQLQEVMGEIRTTGTVQPVTLSASVGVTGLWLLPRLNRFQKHHPGVDLRIAANNHIDDLPKAGIDLAIRYTSALLAPASSIRLFGESVAPVAHPGLGLTLRRTIKPSSKWTLLEFDNPQHPWLQWRDWLSAKEWSDARPQGILHFNQYDQVIQAALAGQGIALGRIELIQPLLDEGRLMLLAPPRSKEESAHAYWLMQATEQAREEVRQVAAWIAAEAAATETWEPRG